MPQIHSILKIYPSETSQDDKSMKILKALDDQLDPKYLFWPMNNRCDKSGADWCKEHLCCERYRVFTGRVTVKNKV